jgi:anti-sigma factor RsiW
MSGCPEKDLHSIYLDGEMPEKFVKEYESHLASCEKCRKELERIKSISDMLKEDALSVKLNQDYLDQSFERLQTKMRFAKNTACHEEKNILRSYTKWVSGFAAAAAVLALIAEPLRINRQQLPEVKAIARTEIKPIRENKVVVDGNLDASKISGALSSAKKTQAPEENSTEEAKTSAVNPNQKVVSATTLASNFSDIDVFRPDFNKSPASVRIEVPGMHTIPLERADNFESN